MNSTAKKCNFWGIYPIMFFDSLFGGKFEFDRHKK